VHLVGVIIRMYRDAWVSECQIPYMSVGRIPLQDITTIISVDSKTFKNAHF
jgi:hypothetical protein